MTPSLLTAEAWPPAICAITEPWGCDRMVTCDTSVYVVELPRVGLKLALTATVSGDGAATGAVVVGLDQQAHDLPGLYVVDGSTVPGPPGVNPQLTIMAMATRAAACIEDALA